MAKDKLIYASAARKAILDADPKLAYCIDSIPGVDAVEVRRGRWELIEKAGIDYWCCSACGSIRSGCYYKPKDNYCPNCGADMRGDNDGK